jgi:hypothetical protein
VVWFTLLFFVGATMLTFVYLALVSHWTEPHAH